MAGGRRGCAGETQQLDFLWVRALRPPWGRLHKPSCAGLGLPACLACAHPASLPASACHLGCLPWASACVLLHHWGWPEPRLEIVAHPSIPGQGSFLISLLILAPNKTGCAFLLPPGLASGLWLPSERFRRRPPGWRWEGGPGLAARTGTRSWLLAHVQPCLKQEC